MAVEKKLKLKIINEIKSALSEFGENGTAIASIQKSHPNVAKNTFYRWVNKVKNGGAPAKKTALEIKRIKTNKQEADEARAMMPANITPDDIGSIGYLNVVDQIGKCVGHADKVLAHCESDKERIRNPKLYLQASRHILDAMKTASYISTQLMEAQKIDQFHRAILKQLKTRDPELVELILMDLEQLNKDWGII